MKREIFHFTGIRKKLIIYYLITTILMGFTSFFSYYNARMVLTGLKTIIQDYVYLNSLNNGVNALMTEVEEYLTTKSSDSILNYYTTLNELQEKARNIPRKAVYDLDSLMFKDIGNMIDELLSETDHAVRAKRGRISSEYIAHFSRANQISEHIKFYINTLLNRKLQKGSLRYDEITKNLTVVNYINLIIIILSIFTNVFLAIFFTYRLTKPIVELSHSAERVSKGDFDIPPTKIDTKDEVSILAAAFDKMVISIKNYIDEIKKQAEFENRLKEQEMQNFKMKSLLKDAELKSLQSQINPHFLFNTLNAAAQLSLMEGADGASEFIENMAELFRYNLRRLDEPVTLADEIKYVKNYMHILKTRFGEKIQFFAELEEDVMDVKMPCTILQPIVENAYIHGLENMERNGVIYLNVKKQSSEIHIEVIDNGMGMDKDRVKMILFMEGQEDLTKKHVTGIGIHNVIDRLRLFYNIADIDDVIEIDSRLGEGTKITLKIPYPQEVEEDDKAFNC